MASISSPADQITLQNEVTDLEIRLAAAKQKLNHASSPAPPEPENSSSPSPPSPLGSPTHFLFLLSDSQLPLGSFAFSSGLESYLAHTPLRAATFSAFLPSSISAMASTNLPFVLAAYRQLDKLQEWDDQLDAATICTVGKRASVAQGRALLGIWERSFRSAARDEGVLRDFSRVLRESKGDEIPLASGHLAPLFGAICSIVGLSLRQTAYVFMLSHVKAVVSAAVRASVFGPYQAQKVLAAESTQRMIDVVIDREWDTDVEDAGQTVPVMDLWIGRHEVLYSRIFNS